MSRKSSIETDSDDDERSKSDKGVFGCVFLVFCFEKSLDDTPELTASRVIPCHLPSVQFLIYPAARARSPCVSSATPKIFAIAEKGVYLVVIYLCSRAAWVCCVFVFLCTLAV